MADEWSPKAVEFGLCACCDQKAIIYCSGRDAWVCAEHFIPTGRLIPEMDYLLAVQRAVVAETRLRNLEHTPQQETPK